MGQNSGENDFADESRDKKRRASKTRTIYFANFFTLGDSAHDVVVAAHHPPGFAERLPRAMAGCATDSRRSIRSPQRVEMIRI